MLVHSHPALIPYQALRACNVPGSRAALAEACGNMRMPRTIKIIPSTLVVPLAIFSEAKMHSWIVQPTGAPQLRVIILRFCQWLDCEPLS